MIWLMPCGRMAASYGDNLAELDWRRLHPGHGSEPFVEALRAGLDEAFRPHYVLVDSRTGFSDVAGLSTHRLADMAVLVFNLTKPCLEGTVRAYRSMTGEQSRLTHAFLVASPVPPVAQSELVERRIAQAGKAMPLGLKHGQRVFRVQYDAAMVLSETLAVKEPETYAAAGRYQALREAIQRANPDDVFRVEEEARTLQRGGRVDEAVERLRAFATTHPDDANAHHALGMVLLQAGRAQEAEEALRQAAAVAPDQAAVLRDHGFALDALADVPGTAPADERRLRVESEGRFRDAVALARDDGAAHNAWGGQLWRRAFFPDTPPEDVRPLFEQAVEHWRRAAEIDSGRPEPHYNLGLGLGTLAKLPDTSPAEARRLREQAAELFRRALTIDPDDDDSLSDCATVLIHLSSSLDASDEGRPGLLTEAEELLTRQADLRGVRLAELYDFACVRALQGRWDEALASLALSLEKGNVSIDHVRADADWAAFHGDPTFEAILTAAIPAKAST